MIKAALVTNTPPPYRIPVFERFGCMPDVTFRALFCCEREPNRLWDIPPLQFDHVFLRERFHTVNGRYIHNNPDVLLQLRRFQPDLVITDGFNPTHLYGFFYAVLTGKPHVAMTDGTDVSEQGLSRVHRAIRHLVYRRSAAFVPASIGGQRHYEGYGVKPDSMFFSCLCIDNEIFLSGAENTDRRYDFMFSGRIEAVKNPLFALEVAIATAQKLGRKTSILFAGAGSLEDDLRARAAECAQLVQADFHGFAVQRELPALYRSARIFLFPTLWDPWGVVANEACASGCPVLVTAEAGVAGELVRNGENGYVCDLDADLWAERSALLLSVPELWRAFSRRGLAIVRDYTFDHAAQGLLAACRHALPDGGRAQGQESVA